MSTEHTTPEGVASNKGLGGSGARRRGVAARKQGLARIPRAPLLGRPASLAADVGRLLHRAPTPQACISERAPFRL